MVCCVRRISRPFEVHALIDVNHERASVIYRDCVTLRFDSWRGGIPTRVMASRGRWQKAPAINQALESAAASLGSRCPPAEVRARDRQHILGTPQIVRFGTLLGKPSDSVAFLLALVGAARNAAEMGRSRKAAGKRETCARS